MDTFEDFSGFFQLFYYCSVSSLPKEVQKLRKGEHWLLTAVHLIVILSIFTFIYFNPDRVYFQISLMVRCLDVAQICGPIIGHLVIIFEAVFYEESDHRILGTIRIIDESSKSFFLEQSNSHLIRKYFLRFIVLLSISPLPVFIIIASTIRVMPQWAIGWIVRYWSLQVGLFLISQYVLYIQFLADRMDRIRQELDNLGNIANLEVKWNQHYIYNHLKNMKRIHSLAWCMAATVARRFKFSILAMLVNTFISITTQGYWLFSRIYYRTSFYTLESAICMFPYISMLIVLAESYTAFVKQTGQLLTSLHRVSALKPDRLITQRINRFSSQIKLAHTHWVASNFIQMDYTFFPKLIFTVTIYLVVFIRGN